MDMNVFRKLRLQPIEKLEPKKQFHLAVDKNSKFIYTGGSDVMKTFKRYGFVPPSEYRTDYLFKQNREKSDE
jgi:hypothetical protein